MTRQLMGPIQPVGTGRTTACISIGSTHNLGGQQMAEIAPTLTTTRKTVWFALEEYFKWRCPEHATGFNDPLPVPAPANEPLPQAANSEQGT